MSKSKKIDAVDVVSYIPKNEKESTDAEETYLIPPQIKTINFFAQEIRLSTSENAGFILDRDSRTIEMLKKYFNFIDPTKEENKDA